MITVTQPPPTQAKPAAPVAAPADQLIEVAFVLDTTGSMGTVLELCKQQLRDGVAQLFQVMPNLRIRVAALGDYEDARAGRFTDTDGNTWEIPATYLYKDTGFMTNPGMLQKFLDGLQRTFGYDSDEAYEYALHQATGYPWTPGSKRLLVILGDENPHTPASHKECRWNWRDEIQKLTGMGVQVHTLQAMAYPHATPFYQEVARLTGGLHLTLDQFATIVDVVQAICLGQSSDTSLLNDLEQRLKACGRMDAVQRENFAKIRGTYYHSDKDSYGARTQTKFGAGIEPVPIGKFQVLDVTTGSRIDDFVQKNGINFSAGQGMYQLVKPEFIADHKDIVLRHKHSGAFLAGRKVRTLVGIPDKGTSNRNGEPGHSVKKAAAEAILNGDYEVFVQSGSNNRHLAPYLHPATGKLTATKFLYPVK